MYIGDIIDSLNEFISHFYHHHHDLNYYLKAILRHYIYSATVYFEY